MSVHPLDPRDILVSLVTAALQAAEADAAAPNTDLIFRPEWRPTPRISTDQSARTLGIHPPLTWFQQGYKYVKDQFQHVPSGSGTSAPASESPASKTPAAPPLTQAAVPASTSPGASTQQPIQAKPQLQQLDAVGELLRRNEDTFNKVIDHPFPRAFGDGTASLDGFRYYMIQDKLYLETCARLKMMAVAESPEFESLETFHFRHKSSLDYVAKLKDICITMLGIPESTIKATQRSPALDASECFYMACLRKEDALLGYYIVLLPCVLTYWEIAKRLMDDPSTAKNVIYHKAWTVLNYDDSSVGKYKKFINENIAAKGGVERWSHMFRIACHLEADLFNTGFGAPSPYQIIPDGIYSIHLSSREHVVLAIQPSVSPADQLRDFFPDNTGSWVVGMKKTGGINERWDVAANKAGYTFKNLGTGLYLGISPDADLRRGRILRAVSEPYFWWINPGSNPDLYQIHDTTSLRYTLHAGIDILESIGSLNFPYTPIITYETSEVPHQMWSFVEKSALEYDSPSLVDTKLEQLDPTPIYSPVELKCASCEELGNELQKCRQNISQLEAGRAVCLREKDVLAQKLEEMKSAKLADVSKTIFIAVMGLGKSGKSTFINLAIGSKALRVGHSSSSCTGAVAVAPPLKLDGHQVVLLDTPSFDHTHKSDTEILREIALALETKYRQGVKLHGIIYLHRISDIRVSNATKEDFLFLTKLCGDQSIRNVVILTKMWDRVQTEDGKRRASELQFDLFNPALERGARLMHHMDGTADFVHALLRPMMENQPEALTIQEELVDQGLDINQTSVGKEVDRWVEKRITAYEAQMDELSEEADQAELNGDDTECENLLQELEDVEAKAAELRKERAQQVQNYKQSLARKLSS